MGTIKSYAKEVLARLKGDEDTVVAQRNYRKATNLVAQQIGAQQNKIVDLESEVEDAQEALANAKYPTSLINNGSAYIEGIKSAANQLTAKQDLLAEAQLSLEFFKTLQTEFEKEEVDTVN